MKTDDGRAALDLVRGTAAILIVIYHLGRWFSEPLVLNSGLAVDLFFCLSGYVLMTAYNTRLNSDMTRMQFFSARLVRLMPLAILGTMISASYAVSLICIKGGTVSLMDIARSTLLGATNLPSFYSPLNRGDDQIFPLNGPQYSLFFEMAVNLIWGYSSWSRKCIPALCLSIFSFGLIVTLGVLGGDTAANFLAGFPRVGASFFCGVILFYVGQRLDHGVNLSPLFVACGTISLALFCFPSPLCFTAEIGWIALLAPVLILSGSRTPLSGQLRRFGLYLGKISYPVYILHYPVFCWINGMFQQVTTKQDIIMEGFLLIAALLLISHLAAIFLSRTPRTGTSRAVAC